VSPRRARTGPEPAVRRCAIYTRKSTAAGLEQAFNSLDAQREACERYIAAHAHDGWEVTAERYDDGGFTGANTERPAFRRLLADVEAGKVDIVVVYKVDRLSRSLLDFARVMDRFNRAGAAFVSVTQNFSTADAMGRLTLNMLMSFAEFEREMIGERTRDKIAASRRKGKWTGGAVPLGYRVAEGRLEVVALEALDVDRIFDLYEQHRSALVVARLLNADGRTTKEHRAGSGRVRRRRGWTKDAVLRTLRNPVYAGFMRSEGKLHIGEHAAIIERERWHAIQDGLDGRTGDHTSHGRNPAYLLRGILRCHRCHGAMTPASTRKGEAEYRYYRCVTRDKLGAEACLGGSLPADAIEGFVIDQLRAVTADGALAREVTERVEARAAKHRASAGTERRELSVAIGRVGDDLRGMADALATTQGTARRLLELRADDLAQDLARHEQRLAALDATTAALAQRAVDAGWVAGMLQSFDAVWDAMTPHNRARLVCAVVDRVEVDEDRGVATVALLDLAEPDEGTETPAPAMTEVTA
jgi:site-specific DNA recombinase